MESGASGLGWQEAVLVIAIILITVSPILLSPFWLPASASRRRAIAIGGAIATAILGGLGVTI